MKVTRGGNKTFYWLSSLLGFMIHRFGIGNEGKKLQLLEERAIIPYKQIFILLYMVLILIFDPVVELYDFVVTWYIYSSFMLQLKK